MKPFRSWCWVFGKRLVHARQFASLSRNALSLKSGCPVKVLRMIERSTEVRLDRDFVDALVTWLGVTREFLHQEPLDDLGPMFLCQTDTHCACGKPGATLLCDGPDQGNDGKTCDALLCPRCTVKHKGLDLCPYCWLHWPEKRPNSSRVSRFRRRAS